MIRLLMATSLLATGACAVDAETADIEKGATIEVQAAPFTMAREDDHAFGNLTFASGLHLTAEAARFGGLSGVDLQGDEILAVTDQGDWFRARLIRDERGRLLRLEEARLTFMTNHDGERLSGKLNADAEAITRDGETLFIGFERNHRIEKRIGDQAGLEVFAEFSKNDSLPANKGVEALASLAGDQLIAVSEGAPGDRADAVRGWIINVEGARQRFDYQVAAPHAPTGADRAGDFVYFVERAYSRAEGVRIRLTRAPVDAFRPGALIKTEFLGALDAEDGADNFEAIAASVMPNGDVRLTLLSDDNFSARQKTLLLEFILPAN